MNRLNIVKVFECENSISLDEQHLADLAGGKSHVREIFVFLTDEEKLLLEKANENIFDSSYYDKLLCDCKYDKAINYFNENSKAIYKDTYIEQLSSLNELPDYAEDNFLDGYEIVDDVIFHKI